MAISDTTTPTPARASFPITFEPRHLTVGNFRPTRERWSPVEQPRRSTKPKKPRYAPFLAVKGHWLDEAGFAIGAKVLVTVAQGRLVLEVAESH
jgi:hypothetical protein